MRETVKTEVTKTFSFTKAEIEKHLISLTLLDIIPGAKPTVSWSGTDLEFHDAKDDVAFVTIKFWQEP